MSTGSTHFSWAEAAYFGSRCGIRFRTHELLGNAHEPWRDNLRESETPRIDPGDSWNSSLRPPLGGRILTLPPPETAGVRYARGVSAISPGFHPGVSRPQDSPTPEGWQSFNPSGVDRTFLRQDPGWYPGLIAAIPPG